MNALADISEADKGVIVRSNVVSGETLFSGISAEHLRQILRKITGEYRIAIQTGEPRTRYIETICDPSEAEARYIRQIGGMANYAQVEFRLIPDDRNIDIVFEDTSPFGTIPKQFIKFIEHGMREAAHAGILEGHEMAGFRAVLIGGSAHETDSNEMAFQIAASLAFRKAAKKAVPVVLEPMMAVQFSVRDEQISQLFSEIGAHRGRVDTVNKEKARIKVFATVPLQEMLSFDRFTNSYMHFVGYERRPRPFDSGNEESGMPVLQPRGPAPKTHFSIANPERDLS